MKVLQNQVKVEVEVEVEVKAAKSATEKEVEVVKEGAMESIAAAVVVSTAPIGLMAVD